MIQDLKSYGCYWVRIYINDELYSKYDLLYRFLSHPLFFVGKRDQREDNNIVVQKMKLCDSLFANE